MHYVKLFSTYYGRNEWIIMSPFQADPLLLEIHIKEVNHTSQEDITIMIWHKKEKWELNVNKERKRKSWGNSRYDRCYRFYTKCAENWSVLSGCYGALGWCVYLRASRLALWSKAPISCQTTGEISKLRLPSFLSTDEIWYSRRVSLSLPATHHKM